MNIFLKKNTCNNPYLVLISCITFIYLFTGGSEISASDKSERSNITIADTMYKEANKLFDEGKYSDAALLYKQSATLYEQAKKWNLQVQSLIDLGNCFRNLQLYVIADSTFAEAEGLAIIKLDKNDLLFSTLYTAQAYLYNATSEFDKSTTLAEKAILIRSEKNKVNDTALMSPYCVLGMNSFSRGEYNIAISYFKKALYFSSFCRNLYNPDKAYYFNRIGQAMWNLGNFENSLKYYNISLSIYNKCENLFAPDQAYNYISISLLYSQLGQYKSAFKYLFLAENFLLKNFTDSKSILGIVRMYKAFNYLKIHDYKKVISECIKANHDLQSDTINNKTYLSFLFYYMGSGYTGLNKTAEAISCYSKCIRLKLQLAQSYDANSFLLLAKAYEKTDQTEKADSTYNTIINYLEKNNESQNPLLTNILLNYGTFCMNNNKSGLALSAYNKTLKICIDVYGFHNLNTTTAYNDLGKLFLKQDKYDEALRNYQLALASQINNIDSTDVYHNPSLKNITADIDLLVTLKGKGHAFYQKYISDSSATILLRTSLKSYELAIASIDKLKILYGNSESSAALIENENETYDEAIKVASQLFLLSDSVKYFNLAFSFAEKSKSSSLLAAIRNNEAFVAGKVPIAFQELEKTLQQQIEQYSQLLHEENKSAKSDSKKMAYWNAMLSELNSSNDYLIQYLEKSYPEYYNLKYNTHVTCADTITSKLSPDEIFIEYTLTSDKLISFIITGKTRKIVSITTDTSFTNSISEYLRCSDNPGAKESESCRQFVSASSKLYKLLLKPLDISLDSKKLIIVPDEQLYNVPFESLLYTDVSGKVNGFRNLPYLINKVSVSYAASGTLLYNNEIHSIESGSSLLAFAPTYKNDTTFSGTDETTRSYLNSLKPLKYSIEEVNTINSIFNGTVFTGINATLENFRKNSSGSGILHLAMHTMIDDDDPMYSKLAFDPGPNDNGLLNTYELYGMQINSQLSVLSACNTGTGKLIKGEGMLCLARGFMYAGCPSIVMTLWEVDDKSGSELMKSFYTYLSNGKSKDEALRLAKLDYINSSGEKKANPYYWAGYINFGNKEPIQMKNPKNHTTFAYIGGLSLISIFIFLALSFRKHFSHKRIMS
jgi:CHAT domain-containing protein